MKTVTLFLLFISITSIFSTGVYAYTLFSPNPSFDTNISYALGYSSAYYHIPNYTWSPSCYGLNGCLNITTDNLTNIQVQLYDQNTFLDTHNSSDFTGHNIVTLPANKEGIVVLRYRSTQDFYGYEGQMAYPKLYVVQRTPTYVVINDTSLISLNDTWYNYTVIVPATSYVRNISIVFGFSSYQPPAEMDIDKFKFYTYDVIEGRQDWNSNLTVERLRYCGNDSIPLASPISLYDYPNVSYANNDFGWIYAYDNDEGLQCDIYKINNIIIARRELDSTHIMQQIKYHDFYGYPIHGCGISGTNPNMPPITSVLLQFSMNLYNAKFLSLGSFSVPPYVAEQFFYTNGTPQSSYILFNSSDSTGLFKDILNSTIQTYSLLNYSNTQIPAGNSWFFLTHWNLLSGGVQCYGTYASGNYPFFDNSNLFINACTPHYSCSSLTNNQSYVNSDCSVTNQTYCGECGCSPYGDYCLGNAVITGSYCDLSDNTSKKFNTYLFGGCVASEINDTCGTNQICIQHILSGQHTIECFNTITGTHDYCINETGGLNANCTGIPLTPLCKVNGVLSDCKSEPIALGIGSITSALGVVGSFLLSLIVSFVISIFILSRDKKGNWGMPSFMVSMLISLGGFTYIGMFPIWFFVVATAIIILGIYFAFRGGKD